jgi:hypothetical protein
MYAKNVENKNHIDLGNRRKKGTTIYRTPGYSSDVELISKQWINSLSGAILARNGKTKNHVIIGRKFIGQIGDIGLVVNMSHTGLSMIDC